MKTIKNYLEKVCCIIGVASELRRENQISPSFSADLCSQLKAHGITAKLADDNLLCDDVLLELKSAAEILPSDRVQLFCRLRDSRKPIGVLLSFFGNQLHAERYFFDGTTVRLFQPNGTY